MKLMREGKTHEEKEVRLKLKENKRQSVGSVCVCVFVFERDFQDFEETGEVK